MSVKDKTYTLACRDWRTLLSAVERGEISIDPDGDADGWRGVSAIDQIEQTIHGRRPGTAVQVSFLLGPTDATPMIDAAAQFLGLAPLPDLDPVSGLQCVNATIRELEQLADVLNKQINTAMPGTEWAAGIRSALIDFGGHVDELKDDIVRIKERADDGAGAAILRQFGE